MKELTTSGDVRMTVKEVAAATNAPVRTIHDAIDRVLPGIKENGKTTYLTQDQVAVVSMELKKAHNIDLADTRKVATTDLEMKRKTVEVMQWLVGQVDEANKKLVESERRNAILMHVSKTYTATEIAKELKMRSAIALNEELERRGVQFKQNGTWVPRADYAQLGYFEIKQEVLDSGRVVYYTRFTQDGRRFVLDLLADMFNV